MARRFYLLLSALLLLHSGCTSQATPIAASPRLHLVSVLYGKYTSANSGEMPADQQQLVSYIDANEREVLQRHSMRSGDDLFVKIPGKPQVVVIYREPRQNLKTEFVALEQQKIKDVNHPAGRTAWIASDSLGIGQEISEDEAQRILTETTRSAEKIAKDTETHPNGGGDNAK
jgi:hypothetical protein